MFQIKAVISVVLAVVLFGGGYWLGHSREKVAFDEYVVSVKQAATQSQAKAATVDTKVVTQYVDRIQYVDRQIPVVRNRIIEHCSGSLPVSPASSLPMPAGSVVHNEGTVADESDAAFAERLADNYANGLQNTEQARACAAWVRANSSPQDATK